MFVAHHIVSFYQKGKKKDDDDDDDEDIDNDDDYDDDDDDDEARSAAIDMNMCRSTTIQTDQRCSMSPLSNIFPENEYNMFRSN